MTKANQRLLLAEARDAAVAAGVKPERAGRFVKLLDLGSEDLMSDDGEIDTDAVKKLVQAELKETPEFVAGKAGGFDGGPREGDKKAGTYEAGLDAYKARHPEKVSKDRK